VAVKQNLRIWVRWLLPPEHHFTPFQAPSAQTWSLPTQGCNLPDGCKFYLHLCLGAARGHFGVVTVVTIVRIACLFVVRHECMTSRALRRD